MCAGRETRTPTSLRTLRPQRSLSTKFQHPGVFNVECQRGDLNSHALKEHTVLNRACLPIPALWHLKVEATNYIKIGKNVEITEYVK